MLHIFLASSSELREDRDQFELYFRRQNDRLRDDGVYMEIVRWEHFLDAMSGTRLQDEYNEKVRNCDVFVSLFFTKAGKYTEEEFDVAYGQFKGSKRPLIYTYFKNADVLQVGDIWWNGHYPFLDNGAGGNIDGLIHWVNECINASTEHTIIVPGHGEISNRAGLTEFRDMLVAVRANVASLKKSGKTLAETVAARPTAAFDAKYGDFLINPAFFIQLVYMDV